MRWLALGLAALLVGCTSHQGRFDGGTRSRTVVDGAQARVVKQLQVHHDCRYVLGVAVDDADMYQGATDALRREASFDGPMALADVVAEQTTDGIWPLYYTRRLTLTARVVRFSPAPADD